MPGPIYLSSGCFLCPRWLFLGLQDRKNAYCEHGMEQHHLIRFEVVLPCVDRRYRLEAIAADKGVGAMPLGPFHDCLMCQNVHRKVKTLLVTIQKSLTLSSVKCRTHAKTDINIFVTQTSTHKHAYSRVHPGTVPVASASIIQDTRATQRLKRCNTK